MAKKPTAPGAGPDEATPASEPAAAKAARKPRARKPAAATSPEEATTKPAPKARKPRAKPATPAAKSPRKLAKAAAPQVESAKPKPKPKPKPPRKPRAAKVPPAVEAIIAPAAVPEPVEALAEPTVATPVVMPTLVQEATPPPAPPEAQHDPAPHSDGLAHGESPVDLPLPDDGEQAGLGWTTRIFIVSSLLLALFNSFAIDKWARALPVTAQSGQIVDAAAAWHAAMDRIDFNLPLETGRSAWHWVKALQWSQDADSSAAEPASEPVEQPEA